MRCLVTLFVALLPAMSADAEELRRYVDLDRPGVLEALQQENPEHYAVAARLIQAASKPCDGQSSSREVRAEVPMACAYTYMASFPPKRRITFQLGDTSYGATVALENFGGEMKPAVY